MLFENTGKEMKTRSYTENRSVAHTHSRAKVVSMSFLAGFLAGIFGGLVGLGGGVIMIPLMVGVLKLHQPRSPRIHRNIGRRCLWDEGDRRCHGSGAAGDNSRGDGPIRRSFCPFPS